MPAPRTWTITGQATSSEGVTGTFAGTLTESAPPPEPPPVITLFAADPVEVAAGEPVTLRWATTNATSTLLYLGPVRHEVAPSAEYIFFPDGTLTCTLQAIGSFDMATASVIVTVAVPDPPPPPPPPPPGVPIVTLVGDRPDQLDGGWVGLSWTSSAGTDHVLLSKPGGNAEVEANNTGRAERVSGAPGDVNVFTVRAVTALGVQSAPASVSFTIAAPFGPDVTVLEDTGPSFATVGVWEFFNPEGLTRLIPPFHYAAVGPGNSASWTASVVPGQHEVAATWTAGQNRTTDATYTILDGTTVLGSVRVNQQGVPAGFRDGGIAWKDLGTFTIAGNSLTVRLTATSGEYVIADAVRIKRRGAPPPTPLPQLVLTLLPALITVGMSAVLRWVSLDATQVHLDGVPVELLGERTVSPTTTTTYAFIATGPSGTVNHGITLAVQPVVPPPLPPPVTDWIPVHGSLRGLPNFGSAPSITAIRSGLWNDPVIWDLDRIPRGGDIVNVSMSPVIYNVVSDEPIRCVSPLAGGHLDIAWGIDTRLTCQHLLVMHNGRLTCGSETNPVRPFARSEIVFPDLPLDLASDPEQWGHGLIALGAVTVHGATKTSHARPSAEARVGDTVLRFAEPVVGWRTGDLILLPDTRQLGGSQPAPWEDGYINRDEVIAIASISMTGLVVTLVAPLLWTHPACYDYDMGLIAIPYVANLTRNVVFRSANPLGTRGHTLFTGHRVPDLRYAEFRDLGRTTIAPLDNTRFNPDLTVAHVGTNQIGRYAGPHLHHCHRHTGPRHARVEGCVARGTTPENPHRWGVTFHGVSFSDGASCVVHNVGGAGFVTEQGTERQNEWRHCLASSIAVYGSGLTNPDNRGGGADIGFEGTGFWTREASTRLIGCASYNSQMGFMAFLTNLPPQIEVWATPEGAMETIDPFTVGLHYEDCEAGGGRTVVGMSPWEIGTQSQNVRPNAARSFIRNLRIFNVYDKAYVNYKANKVALDNPEFFNRGRGSGYYGLDYVNDDFEILGGRIEGFVVGLNPSTRSNLQVVRGTRFCNHINVVVTTRWGSDLRLWEFRLEDLDLANGVLADAIDWAGPPQDLVMNPAIVGSDTNLVVPSRIYLARPNGVPETIQVYWNEQRADYILPQTGTVNGISVIGCPVAGLTNAQALTAHGVCWAGSIAPADAHTRTRIVGLVSP